MINDKVNVLHPVTRKKLDAYLQLRSVDVLIRQPKDQAVSKFGTTDRPIAQGSVNQSRLGEVPRTNGNSGLKPAPLYFKNITFNGSNISDRSRTLLIKDLLISSGMSIKSFTQAGHLRITLPKADLSLPVFRVEVDYKASHVKQSMKVCLVFNTQETWVQMLVRDLRTLEIDLTSIIAVNGNQIKHFKV